MRLLMKSRKSQIDSQQSDHLLRRKRSISSLFPLITKLIMTDDSVTRHELLRRHSLVLRQSRRHKKNLLT